MTIIWSAIFIAFIISVIWIWNNLGFIEKREKVLFILIGTTIIFFITTLVFHMSQENVTYESPTIKSNVQNVLVSMFTVLNSLIFLPYIAKLKEKIKENELEKNQIQKRIMIIIVVFIICIFLESGYLNDIQKGILNSYKSNIK